MNAHAATEASIVNPSAPDRHARLPLRAELFLLAHDDDTGNVHINEQTLALGLAGAILMELWLAGRVVIGWTHDRHARAWQPAPGRITINSPGPAGDLLHDAGLAVLRHTPNIPGGRNQLRAWIGAFAATDLYERTRANLVTVGVMRRTTRRRFGLVKVDAYAAAHYAWPVRARSQLRSVIYGLEHPGQPDRELPDDQCAALCGLIYVMELAPFLYLDMPTARLHRSLRHIAEKHNPTIHDVIAAVDAARGDLAVTAMG